MDWYPWGDEAFEVAARTGRPVLLSIGYATCHWCHVMSEESFQDPEIARFLNEHFVAIKVDREERPDVDAVYLTAVEGLTKRPVGWPLTVFLTADRAPFHGDGYRPPRDGDRGFTTGFLTVLQRVAASWAEDPDRFRADAAGIARVLATVVAEGAPGDLPDATVLDSVLARVAASWDPEHGGSARPPKFPNALPLRFLLRQHQRTGDPLPLQIARVTLDAMAQGALRDPIDGGFHRYTVDAAWRIPHFEKTLYDNAQLATLYAEAWTVTGDPAHREVALDTLRWLDQRMSAPGGGWWSALDAGAADPSGRRVEGLPYTWTPAEIRAALPQELATPAIEAWGITEAGDLDGRSVPHGRGPEAARVALLAARDARPQPAVDDKVITAWNGLAVGAFARGSVVFAEPALASRAARAADAVWDGAWRDGALRRIARVSQTSPEGVLEDYAFLAAGLLDLFEATAEPRWLERALLLDGVVAARFTDAEGGMWRTAAAQPGIPRQRPDVDGPAEPSGTSVHTLSLLRLAALTGDDAYRARAEAAMRTVAGRIAGGQLQEMLVAVDWRLDRPREIVVVVPPGGDPGALLAVLRAEGPRNRVQVVVPEDGVDAVGRVAPIVAGKVAVGRAATAYVCERGLCRAPATTPEALREALGAHETRASRPER